MPERYQSTVWINKEKSSCTMIEQVMHNEFNKEIMDNDYHHGTIKSELSIIVSRRLSLDHKD